MRVKAKDYRRRYPLLDIYVTSDRIVEIGKLLDTLPDHHRDWLLRVFWTEADGIRESADVKTVTRCIRNFAGLDEEWRDKLIGQIWFEWFMRCLKKIKSDERKSKGRAKCADESRTPTD